MNKNYTEVVIGGKTYDIGGYEDSEYLQRVASYINSKLSELKKTQGFLRQPQDFQNVMLFLNIADDYYKMKGRVEELEERANGFEKEVYQLKHELVSQQLKQEKKKRKASAEEEN